MIENSTIKKSFSPKSGIIVIDALFFVKFIYRNSILRHKKKVPVLLFQNNKTPLNHPKN